MPGKSYGTISECKNKAGLCIRIITQPVAIVLVRIPASFHNFMIEDQQDKLNFIFKQESSFQSADFLTFVVDVFNNGLIKTAFL